MTKGNPMQKFITLLLCGVRAASLWRTYGGNRWNLLFARRKLEEALRGLAF